MNRKAAGRPPSRSQHRASSGFQAPLSYGSREQGRRTAAPQDGAARWKKGKVRLLAPGGGLSTSATLVAGRGATLYRVYTHSFDVVEQKGHNVFQRHLICANYYLQCVRVPGTIDKECSSCVTV
jgi:hypothetical protein